VRPWVAVSLTPDSLAAWHLVSYTSRRLLSPCYSSLHRHLSIAQTERSMHEPDPVFSSASHR
jgi:hypothetical protein